MRLVLRSIGLAPDIFEPAVVELGLLFGATRGYAISLDHEAVLMLEPVVDKLPELALCELEVEALLKKPYRPSSASGQTGECLVLLGVAWGSRHARGSMIFGSANGVVNCL